MNIDITKRDISRGVRESVRKCPIALALKRKFPASNIIVTLVSINIDGCGYWLSRELRNFVYRFDHGHLVQPLSFDLEQLVKRIDYDDPDPYEDWVAAD